MPWNSPADTLAVPRATSSWLVSIGYRCLAAYSRASVIDSRKPMNVMATATGMSAATTSHSRGGTFRPARPPGTGPTTAMPCSTEVEQGGQHGRHDQDHEAVRESGPPAQQQEHGEAGCAVSRRRSRLRGAAQAALRHRRDHRACLIHERAGDLSGRHRIDRTRARRRALLDCADLRGDRLPQSVSARPFRHRCVESDGGEVRFGGTRSEPSSACTSAATATCS